MDLIEFTAAMQQRGCVTDGKSFCGSYRGLPFAVTFVRGGRAGVTVCSLRVRFARNPRGKMYAEVRRQMKGSARIQPVSLAAGLFTVNVTAPATAQFGQVFDKLLEETAAAANLYGMAPPEACPVCKQPGCDSYAYMGLSYQPVHAACVQTQAYTSQMKVRQNEQSGSYALGALGALLGGIAGTVPTVLTVVFLSSISAWLCALIPLGAYLGYKLLGGKMTRIALLATVLVSALMAPFMEYFTQLVWELRAGYGLLSPVDYFYAVFVYWDDFGSTLIPSLLQTLLFIGIGCLVVSGIITRTNKHEWQAAGFSAATLRPISGTAPYNAN